jgi:hypothetical protein
MVFNGNSFTTTGGSVVNLDTDNSLYEVDGTLVPWGALVPNHSNMLSLTPFPLPGVSGIDISVIYGDCWNQIGAQGLIPPGGPPPNTPGIGLQPLFPANLTTMVRGNETKEVIGDQTTTIDGNVSLEIDNFNQPGVSSVTFPHPPTRLTPNFGSYMETVHGPATYNYLDALTYNLHDVAQWNQPDDSSFQNIKYNNVKTLEAYSAVVFNIETVAIHAEGVAGHLEVCAAHGEFKGPHLEWHLAPHVQFELMNVLNHELTDRICVLKSTIAPASAKIEAICNLLPDLEALTPFG